MKQVEEKIIKTLLNSPQTVGDLTEILGYEKRSYSNVTPYLKIMEENNILETKKDKSVKRPGSKPTILNLKEDITTLKKIWKDYPGLRNNIFKSDYYHSLIYNLIPKAQTQVFGSEPGREINYKPSVILVKKTLQNSITFTDYVLSCSLAEVVENNFNNILRNNQQELFFIGMEDEFLFLSHLNTILRDIIKSCAILDSQYELLKSIKNQEREEAEFWGFFGCVAELKNEKILSKIDFELINAALKFQSPNIYSFKPFKWLKFIPEDKKNKILQKMMKKLNPPFH